MRMHMQVIDGMPAEIELREDACIKLKGLMCLYGRTSHCWFTCQPAAAGMTADKALPEHAETPCCRMLEQ